MHFGRKISIYEKSFAALFFLSTSVAFLGSCFRHICKNSIHASYMTSIWNKSGSGGVNV